ncbi:FolC bifunctional protein [Polychaeton citri CBS 116435]|uniref:FolC bifunctional protein n=1 Tax=Polychaeton citri CBS 116435 TaxID=1314669 RepID=A0A9P4Q277_9PEZI|nr:FolC bifunctional protein [Polychaeton citri CBS 116435]
MIELGLSRISGLLAETSLPWRAIHVAGTNGKGSICAYVSGMLEAYNDSAWRQRTGKARLKHARYTSPHLIDRWDCITIDQRAVSFSMFDAVEKKVLARDKRLGINASEFELLTATAFEIFTQEKVDVAVVEVGMGGRLDATNVIGQTVQGDVVDSGEIQRPLPLVCALAKIGLDHQSFLGDTIEAIAAEKAGIIKPGSTVVYDESNPDNVLETFRHQASISSTQPQLDINSTTATNNSSQRLPTHSRQNTSVALTATWTSLCNLHRLPPALHSIPQDSLADLTALLRAMLQVPHHTRFPGRLQRLSLESLTGRTSLALLDGAHNAQSATALAAEVHRWRAPQATTAAGTAKDRVTWLVAASSTKDASEILSPILQPGDAVFTVEFGPVAGMPWVQPAGAAELAAAAVSAVAGKEDGLEVVVDCGSNVAEALGKASGKAAEGPLVIAGSLYLVSDVLRLLRDSA